MDLSPIPRNSQCNWSFYSESIDDSNLENWAYNSEFLDENFSSLLSSISIVQPLLDLKSSHLHQNSPESTLCVNDTKLQGNKDAIPSASKNTCTVSCESNLTVLADTKGRSQVKFLLICDSDTSQHGN